jgi:hypothetical protein
MRTGAYAFRLDTPTRWGHAQDVPSRQVKGSGDAASLGDCWRAGSIAVTDLSDPAGVSNKTGLYVGAVVALSLIGVGAIITVLIVRPPPADNTGIIVAILGFLVPTVTALLAAAVQQVHLAVNSRLTQHLTLTASSARAEGHIEGANQQATGPQGDPGQIGPRGPIGVTGPPGS